ncbi:DNA-directed DNA polymerase II small subunit [Candidatus Bathyarchaeota archaeon]|nr:MAG: DNA-directed DNA polymerase II small subunit [Candidatus Bathyarchaeota archaeon]
MTGNLQEAVKKLQEAGYQLSLEGFNRLKSLNGRVDPLKVAEKILEAAREKALSLPFVDASLVEEAVKKLEPAREETVLSFEPSGKPVFRPLAREYEAEIEVLKDPTGETASKGDVESFLKHFRDRFERLKRILMQRLDCRDASSLQEALSQPQGSKVKFVCMVSEKFSRGRRVFLRVEDPEASATVMFQPTVQNPNLAEKASSVFPDQVICVSAVRLKGDFFAAEDLMLPEIPHHKPHLVEEPLTALLISDLHVGSKLFEGQLFRRMLSWLKGEFGGRTLREAASRVKYLVIAGDLVDGVGVYPEQERELEIPDIYRQYEEVARLLEEVPDYIQILAIPGNHDATRKALPQPAINRSYGEALHRLSNLLLLGNPSTVKLHGAVFLLHHGRSLEDVLAMLPEANHEQPVKAMVALLKARHLAPIYGQRTPIAPEPQDWMVVDQVPDYYHAGHIHIYGYTVYRGIRVVNSGCWQRQTSYQQRLGLTPTPATAILANLQDASISLLDFRRI